MSIVKCTYVQAKVKKSNEIFINKIFMYKERILNNKSKGVNIN